MKKKRIPTQRFWKTVFNKIKGNWRVGRKRHVPRPTISKRDIPKMVFRASFKTKTFLDRPIPIVIEICRQKLETLQDKGLATFLKKDASQVFKRTLARELGRLGKKPSSAQTDRLYNDLLKAEKTRLTAKIADLIRLREATTQSEFDKVLVDMLKRHQKPKEYLTIEEF